MRDLAVRSVVAAMVGAGVLLGGAGIAVADTSGAADASTARSYSTVTTAPTTTTSAPVTTTEHSSTSSSSSSSSETTTSSSSSSETTTSSSSSETTTSSSSSPATTTHPGQSAGTATAQQGCLGEVTVVVSGTDLAEGTLVDVQLSVGDRTTTVQSEVLYGRIAVIASPDVLAGVDTVGVLVLLPGSDAVYAYDVPVHPLTDVCTAEGGISLARDCATPDSVLATVEASGLTAGGVYGISVVGTSPSGVDVVLASADVVSADGTLDGTLPLVSATGTVPLDGFTGFALLVDGQVFASVGATDAVVGTCVVPAPLPVAPVHPAASTTPAAAAHPAQPAALAQTGTETGSLLLLAGAFLVVGGLATLLARRTAR